VKKAKPNLGVMAESSPADDLAFDPPDLARGPRITQSTHPTGRAGLTPLGLRGSDTAFAHRAITAYNAINDD